MRGGPSLCLSGSCGKMLFINFVDVRNPLDVNVLVQAQGFQMYSHIAACKATA
jgi:hypothetical protein